MAGPSTQLEVLRLKVIKIVHEIVARAECINVVRDAASPFFQGVLSFVPPR